MANVLSDEARDEVFQLFRDFYSRMQNESGHRATYFATIGDIWIAKTTTTHDKDATQTVDFYAGATKGSETTTGDSVDAYNRFADLASDKWCLVMFLGDGWELFAGEC